MFHNKKDGFAQRTRRAQRGHRGKKAWIKNKRSSSDRGHGDGRYSQAQHRGVSVPSFRDSAIRFRTGLSRGPVGYPAMIPHGDRGVSVPSFRDGAIRLGTPTFKLAYLKDRVRTEGKENTEKRLKKVCGVGFQSACLSGNAWERQTLVWQGFIFY